MQKALQLNLRLRGILPCCSQSIGHVCSLATSAGASLQEVEADTEPYTEPETSNSSPSKAHADKQPSISKFGGMNIPNADSFYKINIARVKQSLAQLPNPRPKSKEPAWYLSRMDFYVQEDRANMLEPIYREMLLEGVRVPLEVYRTMIFAFGPSKTFAKFVNLDGLLWFRMQMRRHGYPVNDQINAAVISAARLEKRHDVIHEFMLDLEASGEADSHRIRKVLLVYHSHLGNKEECLKLLDECLAKKDPYLVQVYQETLMSFAPPMTDRFSVEEPPKLDEKAREEALDFIFRVLEDARVTLDFEHSNAEKGALFDTALTVLDRLGLYAEVLPCFNEISRPSAESHQRLYVARLMMTNSPELSLEERMEHANHARKKLDGFIQRGVGTHPTMTYLALLACLKKDGSENEALIHKKLACCDRHLENLLEKGRYITRERSEKLEEHARRHDMARVQGILDKLQRVAFMTYLGKSSIQARGIDVGRRDLERQPKPVIQQQPVGVEKQEPAELDWD